MYNFGVALQAISLVIAMVIFDCAMLVFLPPVAAFPVGLIINLMVIAHFAKRG